MIDFDTSSGNFDQIRNPDEVKLIERVVSGDNKAIEHLLEKYRKVVLKISERYVDRKVTSAKLFEVGNHGLLTAANRFHYTNGINFIAYAAWWISDSFKEGLSR